MSENLAYTYCKVLVPGGVAGLRHCNNAIPLGDKECSSCRSKKAESAQPLKLTANGGNPNSTKV